MTGNQIAALKYLILASKDGSSISKRIMWYLIDRSHGLTEEVCLSLIDGRGGYTADQISAAANGVDAMGSLNCSTHIHEIMVAMGSPLSFSTHYGDFDPKRQGDPFNTDGMFAGFPPETLSLNRNPACLAKEGMPLRHTFWLSQEAYSRGAKFCSIDLEDLEKIDLKRPDLKYRLPETVGHRK